MNIFYNDVPTPLPPQVLTLGDLADWKKIPQDGAAVALNDRLIKKEMWPVTPLSELDRITVITAAYGG